jgi:hypothetical protein
MENVSRFAFLRAVFWRPTVGVVSALYAFWGALDFLGSKLAGSLGQQQWWNDHYILPGVSWQTWALVGAAIMVIATFEGAYRLVVTRDRVAMDVIAKIKEERDVLRSDLEKRRPMLQAYVDCLVMGASETRSVLAVVVNITNRGLPSMIEHWGLWVTYRGMEEAKFLPEYPDDDFAVKHPDGTIVKLNRKDELREKAARKVDGGDSVRGYLCVPITQFLENGDVIRLTFQDVDRNQYEYKQVVGPRELRPRPFPKISIQVLPSAVRATETDRELTL